MMQQHLDKQHIQQPMPGATLEKSLEWCQKRTEQLASELHLVQEMQRELQAQIDATGECKLHHSKETMHNTNGQCSSSDECSSGESRSTHVSLTTSTCGSDRGAQRSSQPPAHTDGPPRQDQTMKAQ